MKETPVERTRRLLEEADTQTRVVDACTDMLRWLRTSGPVKLDQSVEVIKVRFFGSSYATSQLETKELTALERELFRAFLTEYREKARKQARELEEMAVGGAL